MWRLRYFLVVLQAVFMLTRCREAVSYNTCEYYHTFRWSIGICEMLNSASMPWPNLWNMWKPPMSCPAREVRQHCDIKDCPSS